MKIIKLINGLDFPALEYATANSAGVDLMAANYEPIILKVGQTVRIPTGVAFEIDDGFEAQIRSRSGLSFKDGIIVLNAPATIDADYKGQVEILLHNISGKDFTITRGMKIAQVVLSRFYRFDNVLVNGRERGTNGFGSTGV